MKLNETLIFYAVVGLAVAVAVYLRSATLDAGPRAFRFVTAVLFWPLYVPVLLSGSRSETTPQVKPGDNATDEMARTIGQVESELDAALSSLDGWAEDVLAREKDRLSELRVAWTSQAARIRDMDRLFAEPEFVLMSEQEPPTPDQSPAAADEPHEPKDRRRQSELSRQKNIERLREVRRQAYNDLMDTLAWVRELVSMIHLAKFTGAPASRAEELVNQIAAAVEGVSAVTWKEVEPLNC